MSALPPKADIPRRSRDVRFGPIADNDAVIVESPKNWATIFRALGFPVCIFDRTSVLVLRSGSRNAFDLAAVEAAVAAAVAAA